MAKAESLPLYERKHIKNTIPRLIELTILLLCFALLSYRLLHLKDHGLVWLLALACESWFTFTWILVINLKWSPTELKTYPERLLQQKYELPSLDMFVTTADPVLEPPILTANTVISLLALDYPADRLACYVSDDAASPLTYYCLVQTAKFAVLWVPFCKKYNIPVRAPFRYFSDKSLSPDTGSSEFRQDCQRMKDEYSQLCEKIDDAAQKSVPCDLTGDFAQFSNIQRTNHPPIIKVIWENKQGVGDEVPHLVYISREKHPKHPHHFKAGAMNVLTRVSGVMTNASFMVNVDCDMFANNPQVALHSMCLLLGTKDEKDCGFVQFPQKFYDGLKDDPFGNQMVVLFQYVGRGICGIQGPFYGGTGCFHIRKVIYGMSPNDKSSQGKLNSEDLERTFGKGKNLKKSVCEALLLSSSNPTAERVGSLLTNSIDEASQLASCGYEHNTCWGKKIGWLYGSTTEDVLTGLNIHAKGWKSMWLATQPDGFLGCAPSCGPDTLVQQKRWSTGLLEIIFCSTGPLAAALHGQLELRQLLAYLWILTWGMRSIFEITYAALPAYCLITNTNFLPKVDEAAINIPISIFLMFNIYCLWEYVQAGQSIKAWWNNQKMARINCMTAWLLGFISVIMKLLGIADTVFEVTKKEQKKNNTSAKEEEEDPDDGCNEKRFTFGGSPIFVPGTTVLLINLTALGYGFIRLLIQGQALTGFRIGEFVCAIWVVSCFWAFFKGLFGKGKYGIPLPTVYKSMALGLLFLQFCRSTSRT